MYRDESENHLQPLDDFKGGPELRDVLLELRSEFCREYVRPKVTALSKADSTIEIDLEHVQICERRRKELTACRPPLVRIPAS